MGEEMSHGEADEGVRWAKSSESRASRGGRSRRGLGSSTLALGLAAFILSSMVGRADAVTAVFLVPVYDWRLVWAETRNDNYILGGLWRWDVMSLLNNGKD